MKSFRYQLLQADDQPRIPVNKWLDVPQELVAGAEDDYGMIVARIAHASGLHAVRVALWTPKTETWPNGLPRYTHIYRCAADYTHTAGLSALGTVSPRADMTRPQGHD